MGGVDGADGADELSTDFGSGLNGWHGYGADGADELSTDLESGLNGWAVNGFGERIERIWGTDGERIERMGRMRGWVDGRMRGWRGYGADGADARMGGWADARMARIWRGWRG